MGRVWQRHGCLIFALDSVVVTVDGWDHLIYTGSKLAYCRFFLPCFHGDTFIDNRGGKVNISLTPKLEQYVKSQVEAGLYRSASDVVCEALRLLEERDALRGEIEQGLSSLDVAQGRALDIESIKSGALKHQANKEAGKNK